jgi:Conserved in the green lineage and diatoms 27
MSINKHKEICPIPFDQQPFNEYLNLKKNILFNWSTKNFRTFIIKLIIIFIYIICLGSSIYLSMVYYGNLRIKLSYIFYGIISAICIIEFILIRLYLGWSYVLKRLLNATVFYEESGWYDGQFWVKPANILIQDRLIGIYYIMPILEKIKVIFIFNSCFIYLSFIF